MKLKHFDEREWFLRKEVMERNGRKRMGGDG